MTRIFPHAEEDKGEKKCFGFARQKGLLGYEFSLKNEKPLMPRISLL